MTLCYNLIGKFQFSSLSRVRQKTLGKYKKEQCRETDRKILN